MLTFVSSTEVKLKKSWVGLSQKATRPNLLLRFAAPLLQRSLSLRFLLRVQVRILGRLLSRLSLHLRVLQFLRRILGKQLTPFYFTAEALI